MPGDLFCLLLESGATGLACQAVGLPVFDGTLLPSVQVSPGSTAINIPPRGRTSPIPAGNYGKLNIRSGGVLRLAGGSYTFRSINVGPRAQFLCTAACDIGVAPCARRSVPRSPETAGRPPRCASTSRAKRNRAASRAASGDDQRRGLCAALHRVARRRQLRRLVRWCLSGRQTGHRARF
jgi:hypothetical protein